jgi:hypothetical protein
MPIIPAIQEVEIRRIMVRGQPGQKVSETPFQQISQTLCVSVIQTTWEALQSWSALAKT